MGEIMDSTGKSSTPFFFSFLLILCAETNSQSERLLSLMASTLADWLTSALLYQSHYT